MHKEIVISIPDIRYVAIECPHCRTKVILDMQEQVGLAQQYESFAPRKCPGCEAIYDSAIQPSLQKLRDAWRLLMKISDSVTFRSDTTD
ncbi:MAG TPA: hypothetical protein VHY79_19780 [Rhizomicrobium sp.]|nr:hypothetical protein [Rhizomicrobium sp.]